MAVVAAMVGFVLWHDVPAAQLERPSVKAKAAQSPASVDVQTDGDVISTGQGRPAEAVRLKTFEDLKRRARAGDAVAQRLLADTYESCYIANFNREHFLNFVDVTGGMMTDPAELRGLERAARERVAQCDVVDGGAIVPLELIRGWYAQAAENGDLAARLTDNALNNKSVSAAESASLMEEVLGSNDPAAVFAMGSTLGRNFPAGLSGPAEELVTGDQASEAWQVAACRMGYECGPSSVLMGTMCLAMMGCASDDYEGVVKRLLKSDLERRNLERRVTEILRSMEGR
ncbi:hypothetical protein [uncultured Stenotrophomonas sp.]|uniref:hypothetical protein n=1 Tax=uncultured Stenotrophomonas sp. TaxID=165438 RepID=UPI0028E37BF3|nr:hypothetical protein [uncultured Stenotrophomonas sp.]